MDTPSSRNNVEQVKPADTLLATPPHGFESITPQQIINNGQETETKNHRISLKNKLIAGIAGLGIAASAIGIGVAVSGDKGPAEQPVATAPGEPNESQTPMEPSPTQSGEVTNNPEGTVNQEMLPVTREAFEISGDLSPDDAATTFVNSRLSSWFNAGSNQETADKFLASSDSNKYVMSVAAENSQIISDALFTSDWQNEGTPLSKYVSFEQQTNASTLNMWILTSQSGLPQDREPYKRSISVESIKSTQSESSSATVTLTAIEKDNVDKNSVGPNERILQDTPINGNRVAGTINLQKIDNLWKVSSIEWTDLK